ncbi:hypothetical protein AX16_000026 [Volvariella volvacea WC 439]|nr:hypothetical protein AX16_000026 [Volvariella volvacea WC 439]
MSPSSPEALYHALAQSPNPNASDVQIDLAGDGDVDDPEHDPVLAPADVPQVVVDKNIKLIHFILGCAVLLPWNVMITAIPFFLKRVEGSPLRAGCSSYIAITFTLSNFSFLAHATATSKQTIPSQQTRRCILFLALLNGLLTLSTFISAPPTLFFLFIIVDGALQAAAGSYLTTSLIAVASLFGPSAVQSMYAGQAAVAVAVSGVQVISAVGSLWGLPRESVQSYVSDGTPEERSAFMFFTLSTVFLIASALAHNWLVKSQVYKTVAAPLEQRTKAAYLSTPGQGEERQGLVSASRSQTWAEQKAQIIRVAKGNITYEIGVAYVFLVTLAVFPPITISILPTNPATHPLLFSAVHFLVFNIGDFLGRYLCSFASLLIWSSKRLLGLSLARTLFIPLFLMCNVQRPTPIPAPIAPVANLLIRAASTLPGPIISSDFLYMLILFLFGVSNGYLSSMFMMSVPSIAHNPFLAERQATAGAKKAREDVDVSATVASFCLVGGLVIGSAASFVVRAAVCACNPFLE